MAVVVHWLIVFVVIAIVWELFKIMLNKWGPM